MTKNKTGWMIAAIRATLIIGAAMMFLIAAFPAHAQTQLLLPINTHVRVAFDGGESKAYRAVAVRVPRPFLALSTVRHALNESG